ncbi:O-acetyltransferase OatA [Pseudomonas brassicacearum]|nr:O-acetyltransferase OatA [Pseudomonas brassicacearum]
MHPSLRYRPDIDGLRAIAVMAVVLYHAFPTFIPGGFIGVDVFFVISGYLITGIILNSAKKGRLSILDFYSRRVRRLFPALILVLFCCMGFGWFFLFDPEYKQLGKHVASGIGFVANLNLWSESGYFDSAAEIKPLLHLWSLGVEEQFYLIWPVVIWVGWIFRKSSLVIISALISASFAYSVIEVDSDPAGAFYSPFTRFWELASGGLLVYGNAYFKRSNTARAIPLWAIETSSVGALILLMCGFIFVDKNKTFPGLWAILPVAISLLLIGPAEGSWLNRKILSSKLFVSVGLLSFPLYLWHWPLLSFATLTGGELPDATYRGGAIAVAVMLAWITYKYIETPIRQSERRGMVGILASLGLIVGALGFYVYTGGATQLRAGKEIAGEIGHEQFFNYLTDNYHVCSEPSIRSGALIYERHVRCMQSKTDSKVDVAIIGDSHAEHLFNGLAKALPNLNVAYYIKASPPFVSNIEFKEIYDFLTRDNAPKKIIITMHWIKRLNQIPVGSTVEDELFASVERLLASGKDVYLFDDVPRFPFDPKKCITKARILKNECSIPLANANKEFDTYRKQLLNVAQREPRVKYVAISQYVCRNGQCGMTRNGQLLYRDKNHLNITGSNLIGTSIVRDNPDLLRW